MNRNLTRRDLLQQPVSRGKAAFRTDRPPSGDVLIYIFLRGGMDGLQAVPPYGDPDLKKQRPALAMGRPGAERPAVDLDGFFGLHPRLEPLQALYAEGLLALFHAVGSPDTTLSHFEAMQTMERGVSDGGSTATGWIARHLISSEPAKLSPLRAVVFDQLLPKSMEGALSAMALPSLADFSLSAPEKAEPLVRDCLGMMYGRADALLEQCGAGVLDLLQRIADLRRRAYRPAGGAAYPESAFGRGLRQAAQLIKADLGLEVAQVDLDGWDSHAAQDALMEGLMQDLAAGLTAFARDMGPGLEKVTLVAMSEFGRRVHENSTLGTDHGRGGVAFVLGGGIRGGRVYGAWPGLQQADLDRDGNLRVTTDYRDILFEIVSRRLGNARAGSVFPAYTPRAPGFTA